MFVRIAATNTSIPQESTFPRSREILERILADCGEEEKAKIAGGNAARVYQL